jgi:hypothetical protein
MTIYIFDERGKYLGKFNKRGQGPGEYTYVESYTVDSNGGLHILDLALKRILVYDSAHKFVKKVDIEDLVKDFICFGDKYVLSMPDKNIASFGALRQGLFIFDPENNTYTEITHPDEYAGYDHNAVLSLPRYLAEGKNGFYTAINEYSNIIYKMQFDKVAAKFRFGIDPPYNPHTEKGYRFVTWAESDNMFLIYWSYTTRADRVDYDRIVLFNQDTRAMKVFDRIQNDIDGRELWQEMWTLNGKIVFVLPGDPDETYGEKNAMLMIWHLIK